MSALKRNCVHVTGHGERTIVFGHGFGSDQTGWRRVLPRFEDRYAVVTYDVTGLGRSERAAYDPARYDSLNQHASDLLQICDELRLSRVSYVGHSAGGMIGALAAIREPERFEKLALIGASPHYIDEPDYTGGLKRAQVERVVEAISEDYRSWYTSMLPSASQNEPGSSLVRELEQSFGLVAADVAAHFLSVIFWSDHRADLPKVTTETLVLQAALDPWVPPLVGRYIAEHVQNGTCKLLRARGGHYPHMGEPQQVAEALASFLAQ